MQQFKGHFQASADTQVAIVISKFNEFIGKQLLEGALDAFERCGFSSDQIHIVWVPGAFEIPAVAKRLAASPNFQAVLCLGAVIQGATAHFEYVAGPMASSLCQISVDTGTPVLFSVLTTGTIEQAIERAGSKAGNKGFEGAMAAVEMISLNKQLDSVLGVQVPVTLS